jgi:cation transport ATPase
MNSQTFALSGLHCGACIQRVSAALAPFAHNVSVTLEPMQARLDDPKPGATLDALRAAVANAGNYTLSAAATTSPVPASTPAVAPARTWLQTYYPLLLIMGFIAGASVLVQIGQGAAVSAHETMRYFMAGFFLVFAFFKLLDVRAFAQAYAGYDLLAARWPTWGLIYPFVELALGIAYLMNWQPMVTLWATVAVMGFSALGVFRAVLSKQRIPCACLGTVFQLPMSTVTIVEDVGMVLMAAWMLVVV